MTRANTQIDKSRVLFWVLAFLGFAVVGYVYRWWSGDARAVSVFAPLNFDIFFGDTFFCSTPLHDFVDLDARFYNPDYHWAVVGW